jgi:ketosteroid isomerase-like protein
LRGGDPLHSAREGNPWGSRNGKYVEDHWVQVVRFRDGRISEIRHSAGDQYAVDEFFS